MESRSLLHYCGTSSIRVGKPYGEPQSRSHGTSRVSRHLDVCQPEAMAAGRRWTREELLVALNLYHKLNFGQLHARQPAVIAIALRLDRSPNSLAMKLVNLASLDPALKLRGIRGLEGASARDQEVWDEFHSNLNQLAPASEDALRQLFEVSESDDIEVTSRDGIRISARLPAGPTAVSATTTIRRGQDYFRNAVLNNFDGRCGVSGLAVRSLLVASHILPWGSHPSERLNVRNGLALSRLHDAAFDQYFIAFDDELRLILSTKLKAALPDRTLEDAFVAYEGRPLKIPSDGIQPDPSFLAEHRAKTLRLN